MIDANWDQVEIKASFPERVRDVLRRRFNPPDIEDLAGRIRRQGPPPGMTAFEDDGDEDGFTDDDDPTKKRFVGFRRIANAVSGSRGRPQEMARRRPGADPYARYQPQAKPADKMVEHLQRINELITQIYNRSQASVIQWNGKRKRLVDDEELTPVIHQQIPNANEEREIKNTTHKMERMISKEVRKPYVGYKPTDNVPYNPLVGTLHSSGTGTHRETVEAAFRPFIWADADEWMIEHPDIVAAYVHGLWDDMIATASRATQSKYVHPDHGNMSIYELEDEIRKGADDIRAGKPSPLLELVQKTFSDMYLNKLGLGSDYPALTNTKADNRVLKGLIEEAMDQSEIFAQLVQMGGLPMMQLMKPHPLRPNGNPNGPPEQPQEINTLGSHTDTLLNIFLKAIAIGDHRPDGIVRQEEVDQQRPMFNAGSSPHAILRHEFGHWLDWSRHPGYLTVTSGFTAEQEEILRNGIADIRELTKQKIIQALREPEMEELIKTINKAINEMQTYSAQRRQEVAQKIIKAFDAALRYRLQELFPWASEYQLSDAFKLTFDLNRGIDFKIGSMKEFIAESFLTATSPNLAARGLMAPEYAKIYEDMFAKLGINTQGS